MNKLPNRYGRAIPWRLIKADYGRWITLKPSGTHVHLDDGGNIDKGPGKLVGRSASNLSGRFSGKKPATNNLAIEKEKPHEQETGEVEKIPVASKPEQATALEQNGHPERNEQRGGQDGGSLAEDSRPVEDAVARPDHAEPNQVGDGDAKPVDSKTPDRVPATKKEANKRIDRYEKLFRAKGRHQVAEWMGKLRDHINQVGTEEALRSLGEEVAGKGEDVQYAGYDISGEHDADFIEAYLDRSGISLVSGSVPQGDLRAVSTVTPSSDDEGTRSRGEERDIFPTLQNLRDKLHEAKHLPGLEKSEDLSKLMGGKFGEKVPQFTSQVLKKLDETYGEGKWIVKSYGDEAYAGYGIFFPQRAAQLQQDAKNAIWDAGSHLANYGFQLGRDPDTGKVIGLQHGTGDIYQFGTPEYGQTIHGDARHWGDMASAAAENELGAAIPEGKFMAQPAFPVVGISNEERAKGVTFKTGQEGRVHIVTRNGKAEIVPHSTWLKNEHLPVVFESEDTKAMAQAAVDAINALPESERKGQLYAPDIVRTADGYKVVEANPANEAGASGYLQSNPFIIDSYVSKLTGREPTHVKFIRKLLSNKKKAKP